MVGWRPLRSVRGSRRVPIEELWIAPGKTSATPDELCVAVHIPAPASRSNSAYIRLEYRRAMEIAVVGAAAFVTLAADGCELWQQGSRTHVAGVKATEVLDPTGCGDAFRGALLYGLEREWSLERCVSLGNRAGAIKIASRGGQNHQLEGALLGL